MNHNWELKLPGGTIQHTYVRTYPSPVGYTFSRQCKKVSGYISTCFSLVLLFLICMYGMLPFFLSFVSAIFFFSRNCIDDVNNEVWGSYHGFIILQHFHNKNHTSPRHLLQDSMNMWAHHLIHMCVADVFFILRILTCEVCRFVKNKLRVVLWGWISSVSTCPTATGVIRGIGSKYYLNKNEK